MTLALWIDIWVAQTLDDQPTTPDPCQRDVGLSGDEHGVGPSARQAQTMSLRRRRRPTTKPSRVTATISNALTGARCLPGHGACRGTVLAGARCLPGHAWARWWRGW
jgi:hypothetical protein